METNVNYTMVGLFVITLLAAIILAIIWLSSGFSFTQYNTYKIYETESVSGLSIDAPVEYNGVAVGTVRSIKLSRKNPRLVVVLVDIQKGTPVTKGTVAVLSTRGITGITFLALKDAGADNSPLVALPGHRYPIIPTSPSFFLRIDAALKKLSENINSLTNSISELLDPENRQSIKTILLNLTHMTNELAENSDQFGVILKNTAKASAQFGPLLQSSNTVMHTIQLQTLPTTYQLLNNLNDVMRTLSEVSNQLKQNPSILIRGPGAPTLGPGERK